MSINSVNGQMPSVKFDELKTQEKAMGELLKKGEGDFQISGGRTVHITLNTDIGNRIKAFLNEIFKSTFNLDFSVAIQDRDSRPADGLQKQHATTGSVNTGAQEAQKAQQTPKPQETASTQKMKEMPNQQGMPSPKEEEVKEQEDWFNNLEDVFDSHPKTEAKGVEANEDNEQAISENYQNFENPTEVQDTSNQQGTMEASSMQKTEEEAKSQEAQIAAEHERKMKALEEELGDNALAISSNLNNELDDIYKLMKVYDNNKGSEIGEILSKKYEKFSEIKINLDLLMGGGLNIYDGIKVRAALTLLDDQILPILDKFK